MPSGAVVGAASIVQETNTFAPAASTLRDFEAQGIYEGRDIDAALSGTNTEIAGALSELRNAGVRAVPLMRAWAMSGGTATRETFVSLRDGLLRCIRQAGHLDGLALSLHGAWVAEGEDDADAVLIEAVRSELGSGCVIGVCLDLHANVTQRMCNASDFIIAYHTYPHVDQASTGERMASLLVRTLGGECVPVTRLARCPMIVPPETEGDEGPFGELRRIADTRTVGPVMDVSLYPVQPWLDVEELGFGVTVTSNNAGDAAARLAKEIADLAWQRRGDFKVALVSVEEAMQGTLSASRRPVVWVEFCGLADVGSDR